MMAEGRTTKHDQYGGKRIVNLSLGWVECNIEGRQKARENCYAAA
jgi:hypothetical protein